MWTRWTHFFSEALWNFRLDEMKRGRKWLYRWLRIIVLSIRGFFSNKCILRASALTYYLLMSIVPLLTILFAIARGFGYQEHLRNELLEKFQDQKTALFEIISFAERLLEQTRGGIIAGVGILLLFWSAVQLLSNMEEALNQIWDVHKKRSWRHLVSEYFSMLFIAPLIFILSNSATVFIVKYVEGWIHVLPINQGSISILLFCIHLLPYGLFSLFFSFLYFFLPNMRVRFSSAFVGGIIAGTLYLIVQWGYIYFQIGANRYGAIYGSFAALPLFLIWVQLSWFVLLFGAEVSHAHQTIQEHEFEPILQKASLSFKKLVSLWIVQLTIKRFKKHKEPLTMGWLIGAYKVPVALASSVIDHLCNVGLLIEVKGKERAYLPGCPTEGLRIADILQILDSYGVSAENMPFFKSRELACFEVAFRNFAECIQRCDANRLLSEIVLI